MEKKPQSGAKQPRKSPKKTSQAASSSPSVAAASPNDSTAIPSSAKPAQNQYSAPNSGQLAWAALAVSLVTLVVGGYFWYQVTVNASADRLAQSTRLQTVAQQYDTLSATLENTAQQAQKLQERLEKTTGNVDAQLLQQRTSSQSQQEKLLSEVKVLSDSIVKLRAHLSQGVDQWSLTEVEQLMLIANQRLQLFADINLAEQALRLADSGLQQLANPKHTPVRETLAVEIAMLGAVQQPQLAVILKQITALSRELDDLPVACHTQVCDVEPAAEKPPATPAKPTTQTQNDSSPTSSALSVVTNLLADLGMLVQVETTDTPRVLPATLTSPEWQWLLIERIKLVLESSKLAWLRGASEAYAMRLQEAKDLVTMSFDGEAFAVQVWLQSLDELAEHAQAELPDISASLYMLRETMQVKN